MFYVLGVLMSEAINNFNRVFRDALNPSPDDREVFHRAGRNGVGNNNRAEYDHVVATMREAYNRLSPEAQRELQTLAERARPDMAAFNQQHPNGAAVTRNSLDILEVAAGNQSATERAPLSGSYIMGVVNNFRQRPSDSSLTITSGQDGRININRQNNNGTSVTTHLDPPEFAQVLGQFNRSEAEAVLSRADHGALSRIPTLTGNGARLQPLLTEMFNISRFESTLRDAERPLTHGGPQTSFNSSATITNNPNNGNRCIMIVHQDNPNHRWGNHELTPRQFAQILGRLTPEQARGALSHCDNNALMAVREHCPASVLPLLNEQLSRNQAAGAALSAVGTVGAALNLPGFGALGDLSRAVTGATAPAPTARTPRQ